MKKTAIIGSGDLGQLIAHHAIQDRHYDVVGFFDDFRQQGETVNTIPVLGKINDIGQLYKKNIFDCIIIGIGYKHLAIRKELYERFKNKLPFGKIIHSSCYIDKTAQIGEGTVILPNCTLDMNAKVGNNVFLNPCNTLAHDSTIESHCFFAPGITIGGFSTVKECCFIGINTTIIDSVTINSHIQTGGGCIVIKDLEKKGLYVGNPARFIR